MTKHEIPEFDDTVILDSITCPDDKELLILTISYQTDSVYLFKESFSKDYNFKPLLEFTSNSVVLDVRNLEEVKCMGYIRTPAGVEFGSALMFESTLCKKGTPAFKIHYDKPHVEMFINFEKEICKMLVANGTDALYQFLDQDFYNLKSSHDKYHLSGNNLTVEFVQH